MDTGKVRFAAVFVAILCVFAAHNSEGNRKLAERFVENGDSQDDLDIDENTAEQVWNLCRKELQGSTEAVKDLEFDPKTGYYSGLEPDVNKVIIHKAIADLPPNQKETIFDCLNKKSRTVQSTWLHKYQELFSIPRRYLRHTTRQKLISPTPAPALSPSYTITESLHKMTDIPPSPSPIRDFSASIEAPELSNPPSDQVVDSPSPSDDSPGPFDDKDKNVKYLVAAIVASSLAGVCILAVFFLCCVKKKESGVEPKDGQRDEKPLLNFYASDISAGSSQKSQTVGTPSSTTKFNALSTLGASPKSNLDSSQPESRPSDTESSDKTNATLPLPPGRTEPPTAAPPPPKPPAAAPPPPPSKVSRPPNPPRAKPPTQGEANETSGESDAPKTKLKPFFWDKVLANPDHSMVWHDIKAGSFQFNEEMMENLFGYVQPDKNKNENRKDGFESPQFIQIIDSKKSQNLAILLKALNVTTEEVVDALKEGHDLPPELIQTLLKMAPTTEEELKLRLYSGDSSLLGPAEKFLKVIVDIPFAFKRLEALLFTTTFHEEISSIKESFATLEVACQELKNSRLFLKLLEAVLKTGNRMNDGTYRGGAQAFKLDTLLKLSDVKGTDGKTTLLHFVVQEIIRSEGLKAARRLRESQNSLSSVKTEDLLEDSSPSRETLEYNRSTGLQVVSGLSNELENVRKAALIDNENLSSSVFKLGKSLVKTRDFLEAEMKSLEEESEFYDYVSKFIIEAENEVTWLLEEEKRVMALVKSTGDYFYGNAGKDEGSRLFVIVRDFLVMVDKSCKELTDLPSRVPRKEAAAAASPSQESPLSDFNQRLFPGIRERDDEFSSDDEN